MPDRNERFIIVQQQHPCHYLTVVHPPEVKSTPLSWEVIDRGENFMPFQEHTDWKTIARYTTEKEASDMRKLLVNSN
jgi:hypothetical protein